MTQGSWEERSAAGEALAPRAGDPRADASLLEYLLDPEDTAVTYRTARALLDQRTTAAWRLIVVAGASTDDNHRDWLSGAIGDFFADTLGTGEPFLRHALELMQNYADPELSRAAREWATWCGWA